ncbi:Inner centromere protein [Varanus komodoensis]|nr:Inner centromere protein [Varanus komodoensis]
MARRRAFFIIAPHLWNTLPKEVRLAPSVLAFQHQVNAFLFNTFLVANLVIILFIGAHSLCSSMNINLIFLMDFILILLILLSHFTVLLSAHVFIVSCPESPLGYKGQHINKIINIASANFSLHNGFPLVLAQLQHVLYICSGGCVGNQLSQAIIHQYYHPPDTKVLFGVVKSPKLEEIFYKSKPRYFKRTSSAVWNSPPFPGGKSVPSTFKRC